jgi:hypothetical protein
MLNVVAPNHAARELISHKYRKGFSILRLIYMSDFRVRFSLNWTPMLHSGVFSEAKASL